MMKASSYIALILICLMGMPSVLRAADVIGLRLDHSTAHQMMVRKTAAGFTEIVTSGDDPNVATVELERPFDTAEYPVFAFEYFCPDGVDDFTVYFGPPIAAGKLVSAGALPKAETWVRASINMDAKGLGAWNGDITAFRIDPGTRPGVRLQLRNLHLRAPNAEELKSVAELQAARAAKQLRTELLKEYLKAEFPAKVADVRVRRNSIRVSGVIPNGRSDLALAEVRMHEEPWALTNFSRAIPLEVAQGGSFERSVPRFDGNYDRLISRWAVVERKREGQQKLASHAVSATDVSGLAPRSAERPKPRSKKGMGGVEFDRIAPELVELGVKHITVNITVHDLISLVPEEGAVPHEFEGVTYYMLRDDLDDYDDMIRFGTKHGMIVSLIILTGFPEDKPELREVLIHPESASPGIFGMPNLTEAAGVRIYAAALDFLAQRYGQEGGKHGKVWNWIMHNEVDYAWTWANMGEQPMSLFMDACVRSMRMAHLIARKYNPHARTFLSLTHSWHTEGKSGRSYPPRSMVDRLAEYSQLEGDFEWGIAYHPYPESLFKPATWNDSKSEFRFDTPMITPKNIEVLDAYMKLPFMLYRGKPRGVLLSEQGFHTNDYDEKAQELQAAAFVYTWHKIRKLESIEAFQNHRWVDHPLEGGLKVGLRTLPESGLPFGRKKLAWEVFKALDTPGEAAVTEFAKPILGVKDFSEIPFRREIK